MCLSQMILPCAEGRKPRAAHSLPAERLQSRHAPAAQTGGDESRLGLTPGSKCVRVPAKVKVVAQLCAGELCETIAPRRKISGLPR